MKDFQSFLTKLLSDSANITFIIRGKEKKIKGMARYTSVNYKKVEYIKIVFDDLSFLLVLPDDEEIYYSDNYLFKAENISDEMIGVVDIVEYNGKKYKLEN